MNKSEKIDELVKALVKFQTKVNGVEMNAINPFYKSKYADLITIIKTCKPVLVANGLAFTQLVNKDETSGIITTMLMHESGQYISSDTHYNIAGKPQEQGSAITYMRRYALAAILGIAADPDDDGEHAQNIKEPSVLDGALEEQVRESGGSFKDKGESKALFATYETSFQAASSKDECIGLIEAAREDFPKLLNYEKEKLKKLITKIKGEWNIE